MTSEFACWPRKRTVNLDSVDTILWISLFFASLFFLLSYGVKAGRHFRFLKQSNPQNWIKSCMRDYMWLNKTCVFMVMNGSCHPE